MGEADCCLVPDRKTLNRGKEEKSKGNKKIGNGGQSESFPEKRKDFFHGVLLFCCDIQNKDTIKSGIMQEKAEILQIFC